MYLTALLSFTARLMINPKLQKLKNFLAENFGNVPVNIAFSGGLDSRFLSFACDYLGFNVKLFHISGPHISSQETEEAVRWARERKFEIEVLTLDPLLIPEVKFNRIQRCYFCKRNLFSALLTKVNKFCDGTNHSDLSVYRPGIRALRELKILSPLAEACLTKTEIRELGKEIGLDNTEQISRPCLITRFPYNYEILENTIQEIEKIEQNVQNLLSENAFRHIPFRVREVGESNLAVHIPESKRKLLSPALKEQIERIQSTKPLKVIFLPELSGYFDKLSIDPKP